jgi:hypothetical protein
LYKRERLNKQPIGKLLTFTDYIGMVFEEPKILQNTVSKYKFDHWVEHLNSFYAYVSKQPPTYTCIDRFDLLQQIIAEGLYKANYLYQSKEVQNSKNEDTLNKVLIRQYTEETNLYHEVNYILRECHHSQLMGIDGDESNTFLAPWILQLNTAIRRQPAFEKVAYRGTNLKKEEIDLYKDNEIFIWASFISASKSLKACVGGNTIFDIFTESSMSLNDKRFGRDISLLSVTPEEEEVLFPIACAYRVHYKKVIGGVTRIGIATVDYN